MSIKGLLPDRAERVMGIDASTKSIAFSVFDKGKMMHYGKVYIEGNDTFERCGDANKKMYHLLRLYAPDLVMLEQAIMVNNRAVVISLANLFGSIMGVVVATGHRCDQVAPSAWMAHIGNPTRNSKELQDKVRAEFPGKSKTWYTNKLREWRKMRTRQWVIDNLGVTIDDDDVSDAIAITHFGSAKYG